MAVTGYAASVNGAVFTVDGTHVTLAACKDHTVIGIHNGNGNIVIDDDTLRQIAEELDWFEIHRQNDRERGGCRQALRPWNGLRRPWTMPHGSDVATPIPDIESIRSLRRGTRLTEDTQTLDWNDIRNATAKFVDDYRDSKDEISDKQSYWTAFFNIFGVDPRKVGKFEKAVPKLGGREGFIDYFWPGKLIIEHKSRGKNLDEALDQAYDYTQGIEDKAELPRYYIVSDFYRIRLIDTENPSGVLEVTLDDLMDNIESFSFIAGYNSVRITGQHPVNIKAAEKMGKLHDLLLESGYDKDYLDRYLVRLVFCLFAEDSGLFPGSLFTQTVGALCKSKPETAGMVIDTIFETLNVPQDKRQKGMSEIAKFPYVNGGLFAQRLPTAFFDAKMLDCLLECGTLDWKEISPAIFGSLFQCVMDPTLRREMGAHYTSEENILRVINPLFMDDLRAEFDSIRTDRVRMQGFIKKLERIRVLDPACGCGNFLIISFRELRYLEMDVLEALYGDRAVAHAPRVTVDHFYGIEYEPFPVEIARIAMWLMEHLTNLERQRRFHGCDSIIPLRSSVSITHGNSMSIDWGSIVDPSELTYIVGNPPFVGSKLMSDEQKKDIAPFFKKNGGIMDYVSGWYVKAANMMGLNRSIRAAFVSTNSITQGEQVEPLWKPLFDRGIRINFAYQTFRWSNEARGNAAVHVIIVGFSYQDVGCRLFHLSNGLTGDVIEKDVEHINAYLVDGPDIFIPNRSKPICNVPLVGIGNKPIDGQNYLFNEEEMKSFIELEPKSAPFFHPWMGAREFINGEKRYCLWLGDCSPSELRSMPHCMERVEAVRKFRLLSKSEGTRKLAQTPTRFHVENMTDKPYLIIPRHSTESRLYLPIGFVDPNVLCGDANLMATGVSLYHFGVLTSMLHMVWMKYVCGRIKSDYRYSAGIVYNNFPWPKPTDEQVDRIEKAAQAVLDARAQHPDSSLADLYDPLTMPVDLLKAHEKLNHEVESAYRHEGFKDDEDRIRYLFELYKAMSAPEQTCLL